MVEKQSFYKNECDVVKKVKKDTAEKGDLEIHQYTGKIFKSFSHLL